MSKPHPESILFSNPIPGGMITGGFLCGDDSQGNGTPLVKEMFPAGEILRGKQVHGKEIAFLFSEEEVAAFQERDHEERCYDGLLTDLPDRVLIIRTADCVPILFYHTEQPLIGALHCGWRPLASGIIPATLSRLEESGVDTGKLICRIGPAICRECYEVNDEVASRFDTPSAIFPGKQGKSFLDLKEVSRVQLIRAGVADGKIEVSPACTRCHPAFHSHRENGTPKRNINFITFSYLNK